MSQRRPIKLRIEKLNLGGQGIGYISGKVCFVDYTIPGEEVTAEIIIEKKDYAVARCKEIIKPSQYRIDPKCPLFGVCGGCQFQHIDYDYQLVLKREVLLDTFRHIGKINISDVEIICHNQWHYRNRAQLPVRNEGHPRIGYYKKGTHEVIEHKVCFINQEELNSVVMTLRREIENSGIQIYDEKSGEGNLRHIIIRRGTNTGQILVIFVTKERTIPEDLFKDLPDKIPNIVGIVQNINFQKTNRILGGENILLSGRNFYEERIKDMIFRIGPSSFFQVNTVVFEKILEVMKEELFGKRIFDLYSGVGCIGIFLAKEVDQVVAVEENKEAVRDGILNAKINNLDNIQFISGRVEEIIKEIKDVDMVILDPPRKGVERDVIEYLSEIDLKKIIYLSCNPATLVRDARLLIDKKYQIDRVFLFDMFPQTYHIESLVTFKR